MGRSIYINTNAQSPDFAIVKSEVEPIPVLAPNVVLGDNREYDIFLVDGDGDFDQISGLSGYTLTLAVGTPGGTPLANQTTFALITNGWRGRLNTDTQALLDFLGGAASRLSHFELEVNDPSGNRTTFAHQFVTVLNEVSSDDNFTAPVLPGGYSTSETNDKFVQNRSAITGLTGGTATDLDGIATVSETIGILVAVEISGELHHYELDSGTDAEDSPDLIRPDDFATTTNEKVWRRRQVKPKIYEREFAGAANTWTWQPGIGRHLFNLEVLDSSRHEMIPQTKEYKTDNSVQVTFNSDQTGFLRGT